MKVLLAAKLTFVAAAFVVVVCVCALQMLMRRPRG
jgi:hypothetical protein